MIHKLIVALALLAGGQGESSKDRPGFEAWYVESLQQVLVTDQAPVPLPSGRIDAARGEVEAIQVAVRSRQACRITLTAGAFSTAMPIRVRTVGRVPIRQGTHHTPAEERVAVPPVELPDPLYPGHEIELAAERTECFWLDVKIPATAKPGKYRAQLVVAGNGTKVELPLVLQVHPVTVPFECNLCVTNWFSARPKELGFGDAAAGSEDWFASADLLFDSMWDHRQNMFWTPLRPPWIKPVATESGQLEFDFTLFDTWVEAFSRPRGGSRKTYIEGQPIAWRQGYDGHVKAQIWRIASAQPEQALLDADDPEAREGYRIFLLALKKHLHEKGWIDRFRIHITDEPHGHQLDPYRVIAGYVREFAPEFRIMEALDVKDDFEFFEKYCDVWVPQLGRFDNSLERMLKRISSGKDVWFYTCLFPNGSYPNRFVDYPLLKTRVLPWINYRWGFTGYLHWGFNQWRGGDPFKNLEPPHGTSVLPPGDAWIVYPGDRQILDSMRHEALRDGVEDFELLTILARQDPDKAGAIAQEVIRNFTDYVRDVKTFRALRLKLLESFD
jgi:glycosyl hydrolase family 123